MWSKDAFDLRCKNKLVQLFSFKDGSFLFLNTIEFKHSGEK